MEIITPFILGMVSCCGLYFVAAGTLFVFCVIAGARADRHLDLMRDE